MNKGLTGSNQAHKDCDGSKEYWNVFDYLQNGRSTGSEHETSPRIERTIARRCFLTLMLKMGW